MSDFIPKDIHREGNILHIEWSDGHQGLHTLRQLRLACQCANCVDEWTRKPTLNPTTLAEDIHPTQADYVGRYAINFQWNDGHTTGIYTFEYLREICECRECKNK